MAKISPEARSGTSAAPPSPKRPDLNADLGRSLAAVTRRILIVQHGDKVREPGDPGLSDLGHQQAAATAAWLATRETPARVGVSPLRRAHETAAPIAQAFGVDAIVDDRLRERMNWDGSIPFDDFLADWERSTADRTFRPQVGDSSRDAAERFLAGLDDLAVTIPDGSTGIVVAHGGITVDTLRTILGDDALTIAAPTLIDDGVPSCAITRLEQTASGWSVAAVPSTSHLTDDTRPP